MSYSRLTDDFVSGPPTSYSSIDTLATANDQTAAGFIGINTLESQCREDRATRNHFRNNVERLDNSLVQMRLTEQKEKDETKKLVKKCIKLLSTGGPPLHLHRVPEAYIFSASPSTLEKSSTSIVNRSLYLRRQSDLRRQTMASFKTGLSHNSTEDKLSAQHEFSFDSPNRNGTSALDDETGPDDSDSDFSSDNDDLHLSSTLERRDKIGHDCSFKSRTAVEDEDTPRKRVKLSSNETGGSRLKNSWVMESISGGFDSPRAEDHTPTRRRSHSTGFSFSPSKSRNPFRYEY